MSYPHIKMSLMNDCVYNVVVVVIGMVKSQPLEKHLAGICAVFFSLSFISRLEKSTGGYNTHTHQMK